MRADMAKVIVERPRVGSRTGGKFRNKGRLREMQRLGLEGLPRCEGIKRMWSNGGKYLNEHLGPLRRYLDSQVGRPWDKVFAEICAHIKLNSAVQSHVRDHALQYVVRNVDLVDGRPWSRPGDPYGPARRLLPGTWWVDPRSGLLRREPLRRRRR